MHLPDFTFDKIKFATPKPTFDKAVELYRHGKVIDFEEGIRSYSAKVTGTETYNVYVEARNFKYSGCNCYVADRGGLCKHIIAVAIYAVLQGKELTNEMLVVSRVPKASGMKGELTNEKLVHVMTDVKKATSYIKSYNGPSSTWFSYQNNLDEGCLRLADIFSNLPVSKQTSDLIIKILISLDKKLSTGGIDDSNGTVGTFIEDCVSLLLEFAKIDIQCVKSFDKLKGKSTCFGWEERIIKK